MNEGYGQDPVTGETIPEKMPWDISVKCGNPGCKNPKFHVYLVDGIRSMRILYPDKNDESLPNDGNPIIRSSLLGRISTSVGRHLQQDRGVGSLLLCGLPTSYRQRIGEVFACILLGCGCTIGPALLISMIWGRFDIVPWIPQLLMSLVWSAGLYFCLTALKDTAYLLGELERKLGPGSRKDVYDALELAFRPSLLFIFAFLLLLPSLIGDILITIDPAARLEAGTQLAVMWSWDFGSYLTFFVALMGIQVIAGYGLLLYRLWALTKDRSAEGVFSMGDGVFKCDFEQAIPLLDRMSEMAIYIVMFTTMIGSAVTFIIGSYWQNAGFRPITSPQISSLFNAGVYFAFLAFVLPLFILFFFLGKTASNLKASSLKQIEREMIDPKTGELWNREEYSRRQQVVFRSWKWIRGVEIGSRILLASFGVLETFILGGFVR
jgi:hypothetical protein